MMRPGRYLRAGVLALLAALAFGSAPAAATVIHRKLGSFNGADAPGGPFGSLLSSDAIDQSSGSVYVTESAVFGEGQNVVDKFNEAGEYAGVQITGAKFTGQTTFVFNAFSGVAVDNSAGLSKGDVYVADTGHSVVDRFSAAGKFICQITAKTPQSEKEEKHECNGAAGSATPECAAEPVGCAMRPTGVAVDARGDVYVADDAHAAIDEFGEAGQFIGQIKDAHLSHEMGTIALDSAGDLYVTNLQLFGGTVDDVVKFDSTGAFSSVLDDHSPVGVGVDPKTDHVYVYDFEPEQERLAEYEPSGALLDVTATPGSVGLGLAVDRSSGKLYVAEVSAGTVSVYSGDVVIPTVTALPAADVAETSATLKGRVDPDAAHGGGEVTECDFEWGATIAYGNTAPCSPAPPYTSTAEVSAPISGLTPGSSYHFRLKATNANGSNESQDEALTSAGQPKIDAQTARVTGVEAILRAQINPLHLQTTCQVQYVEDATFQSSGYAHASTLSCSPEDLGSDFGDVSVNATLNGLKIATTYHYRFVATSSAGSSDGADQTFITYGAHSVKFEVIDKSGGPFTQAAGHPYELRTSFVINQYVRPPGERGGQEGVDGNLKDVVTRLPAGLIGDPSATPRCTRRQLALRECPFSTQVGVLIINLEGKEEGGVPQQAFALYNIVPPAGVASEFAANVIGVTNVYIDGQLRNDGEYFLTAESSNNPALSGLTEAGVMLWGVPAAASHDNQRCFELHQSEGGWECGASLPVSVPEQPLLRNPTSCRGPLTATVALDSWQVPGLFDEHTITMPEITGCPDVYFTPSLELQPTTSQADSPTGLHVDLHIPYEDQPDGLGQADLKDTTVTLPAGLTTNPSAANGLQACSSAQVGLTSAPGSTPVEFNSDPAQCPDAAKIGMVEVDTPLLSEEEDGHVLEAGGHRVPHVLHGAVYVAAPYDNPFNSLLAIYIVIDDKETGIDVKLAGHVQPDGATGQLTTTFSESPQLPFEDFRLDFFGGPHATLATPAGCGSYTASASLTPWSGPTPASLATTPFPIASGCVNGFSPSFDAGVSNLQAGAYAPLTLSFSRVDSDQELSALNVTLPPGLIGKLAGVPLCPEAALSAASAKPGADEAASPSCPAASQVGMVRAGAGTGKEEDLIFLPGKAYLTGPYNGGPYGLAVIVPALAGPFDLGTVVVRSSLRIDPRTAQVTAVSDQFPPILKGIPVRLRRVDVNIDRPQFTLNPTNCTPMAFAGALASTAGASMPLSQRFQVGDCQALRFKPRLTVTTQGRTSKANGASLDVKVSQSPGEANIGKVDVSLPLALPSRLSTLQKACTGEQFDSNPAGCPAASLVGSATAHTPLLASPLSGPAYLVSHGNAAFPDLVVVLQGEGITIELTGNTNIKRGITYSHFDTVPDAPISSFELRLPEGPHSVLTANANLCSATKTVTVRRRVTRRVHGKSRRVLRWVKRRIVAPLLMPTTLTAQDGAVIKQTTKIAVMGCPVQGARAQQLASQAPTGQAPQEVEPRRRRAQADDSSKDDGTLASNAVLTE